METISAFRDEYDFLSNFHHVPHSIFYNGYRFPTVENAFQAAKCTCQADIVKHMTITPSDSKKLARELSFRSDWDSVRERFMWDFLWQKFCINDPSSIEFMRKLHATGLATLIEGNWWHDNFWGDCNCEKCQDVVGLNKLGIMLMTIRRHETMQF